MDWPTSSDAFAEPDGNIRPAIIGALVISQRAGSRARAANAEVEVSFTTHAVPGRAAR
jgi:hypothetical protein